AAAGERRLVHHDVRWEVGVEGLLAALRPQARPPQDLDGLVRLELPDLRHLYAGPVSGPEGHDGEVEEEDERPEPYGESKRRLPEDAAGEDGADPHEAVAKRRGHDGEASATGVGKIQSPGACAPSANLRRRG